MEYLAMLKRVWSHRRGREITVTRSRTHQSILTALHYKENAVTAFKGKLFRAASTLAGGPVYLESICGKFNVQ